MNKSTFGKLAKKIANDRYLHTKGDGTKETWDELAVRVSTNVLNSVNAKKDLIDIVRELIANRQFMPGGRYLASAGRPFHQTQNCVLFRAEDSREGWSDLMYKSSMSLMTGAGMGSVYSDLRPEGAVIKKTGGFSSGPLSLMQMVNEAGRHIKAGGNRRAAIWAGLHWNHPDIEKFITMKNWPDEVKTLKNKDFNFPATMDTTNISTILDTKFFESFENDYNTTRKLYYRSVKQMLSTAEPGFSIDAFANEGENNRNACTEITSYDDSDVCNLGSLNIARFDNIGQFAVAIEAAIGFLLAGTVYSDVPTVKIAQIRDKNRRLGLGLMGIHEWLLVRGKSYGYDAELEEWLRVYKEISDSAAKRFSNEWNLSTPVKTRAIAPTGTIGIVAETTTGIEPIYCVAYKRRYLVDAKNWEAQYVVDPSAKRLIDNGVPVDKIEDAYALAENVEKRVAFQAFVQDYVDHAISSTINLPSWGTPLNNEDTVKPFGKMLMKYLPRLRGVTCYPDGARGGQPISPVTYQTALKHEDDIIYESTDVCDLKGGSCGA
jgi:ribonucleoside-diphosphate reductase alpha chain